MGSVRAHTAIEHSIRLQRKGGLETMERIDALLLDASQRLPIQRLEVL